jgi:thiosulfate reductase cytochrome b subunit
MALGQPVWSRVDEAAHYDVIAQYAAGIYPRDAQTTIRPETVEVMRRTGVYGFVVDNTYVQPDPGFRAMPDGLSNAEHVLWIRRHGYQYSYEAFQPPLYYAFALPAWLAGLALGGPVGALYAVRIFDALLAALLAPLSLLIALRLWPGNRAVGWGTALLTAVLPGVAINLTSVTNDVLVSVLGAACILVAAAGSWSRRRIVLLGLLFGAALLTKTTAVGLAPVLAVALLQRQRGGSVRSLVAAFAIAGALFIPWIVSNLAIYGEAITTREQLAMAAFPARTTSLDFWSVSTLHAFVTFWTGDPFLSLPGAAPLAFLAAFLTALALTGLARAGRPPALGIARPALLVLALASAGAGLVSVTSPVLAAFNAPGRLAYAGLCAVIALVAAGLWVELPSPRLRWATIGVFAGLSLGGLAVTAIPAATPPAGSGSPVVKNQGPLQAGAAFGGFYFTVESCAVDTSGDQWIEVSFANAGPQGVEWSQTVEVRQYGSPVARSDYSRSTQFPMVFAPGRTYSGWLWLGPESRLHALAGSSLHLQDLATDGYRTIGNLDVPVALC